MGKKANKSGRPSSQGEGGNWPATTDNPSGKGRGNAPAKKGNASDGNRGSASANGNSSGKNQSNTRTKGK